MDDAAVVLAVRDAVGDDIQIRADANQAYDVKTAVRVIRRMEEGGVEFVEQPVHRDDILGMAEVRAAVNVPIMADEGAETPRTCYAQPPPRRRLRRHLYVIGPRRARPLQENGLDRRSVPRCAPTSEGRSRA